jgi:glycosyltransferase involved in cell wall biosynthesis
MLQNHEYQQPLVSVITPTYNRVEYLKEALASAVKQTYKNIEIIISDNCSTDNTEEVVTSFTDPRIRYWKQPQNMGMFTNQMHAFKMARGKYIASLHDDDIWNEDFLEKLVPCLEDNSDLILAFCDHYIINHLSQIDNDATKVNTQAYKRDQYTPGEHNPFYEIGLVNKSIGTACAAVIRNNPEFWDKMPPEVGGMWDLFLTYLCSITGGGAYYYPEKLTRYREHLQTDTMQSGGRNVEAKIRKAKSEIFCYQKFMEDERLKEWRPYFKEKWLEAHTTLGIGLLRTEQTAQARPYLWQALNEQKFNLRTLTALTVSFAPHAVANKLLGVAK